MKNIYIIGVPRSGKTTLAHLLKEEYPTFNLISFEAIRNAFIKTQPQLQMDRRESPARKEIKNYCHHSTFVIFTRVK